MATPRRWNKYPTADCLLDAATLNADGGGARNLVRNPYLRGWRSDRPLFFGVRGGTPTAAPARDTTASAGYTAGAAMDWTISAADAALQFVQDVGGALPPTLLGATVMDGWPGLTVTVRVKASAASLARALIRHSGVDYVGAWHSGGGAFENLAVTLPGSVAVGAGDSVEVGVEFGTSGSTQHVFVDRVQAVLGEFQGGLAVVQDARLLAELGPAQAGWSRRSESSALWVVTAGVDGTIRAGDAFVDLAPDWATILAGASVRCLGGFLHAHLTGSNPWTTTQVRKITGLTWSAAGALAIAAQNGQTFGAAGGSLRCTVLWLLEPQEGVLPWA